MHYERPIRISIPMTYPESSRIISPSTASRINTLNSDSSRPGSSASSSSPPSRGLSPEMDESYVPYILIVAVGLFILHRTGRLDALLGRSPAPKAPIPLPGPSIPQAGVQAPLQQSYFRQPPDEVGSYYQMGVRQLAEIDSHTLAVASQRAARREANQQMDVHLATEARERAAQLYYSPYVAQLRPLPPGAQYGEPIRPVPAYSGPISVSPPLPTMGPGPIDVTPAAGPPPNH